MSELLKPGERFGVDGGWPPLTIVRDEAGAYHAERLTSDLRGHTRTPITEADARAWIATDPVPPAQVRIDAQVVIQWDDELGGYCLVGIHIPDDVPEIEGPASTIWLYRTGNTVQGLKQPAAR